MKLLSPKDLSNKSETQEIKIIRDEIVQYDNDRKKKKCENSNYTKKPAIQSTKPISFLSDLEISTS
jgi:hypothetical protein